MYTERCTIEIPKKLSSRHPTGNLLMKKGEGGAETPKYINNCLLLYILHTVDYGARSKNNPSSVINRKTNINGPRFVKLSILLISHIIRK